MRNPILTRVFGSEDQIEARSKNIPLVVYKSRDGVELPEAFMLHETPVLTLNISSRVEVVRLFPGQYVQR